MVRYLLSMWRQSIESVAFHDENRGIHFIVQVFEMHVCRAKPEVLTAVLPHMEVFRDVKLCLSGCSF